MESQRIILNETNKNEQQEKIINMLNCKMLGMCMGLLAAVPLAFADLPDETSRQLWNQYAERLRQDPQRIKEMEESAIPYGDSVMKYGLFQIGDEPEDGYPLFIALHGGGGTAPEINDSQWEQMKMYYRDSVTCGIYVAPRGVTNTWNLHCVADSYPLYDRMIENLILFRHVNPNRVYVMGYSAGGDGVYQIASRMSDRFAGANMYAGHPNRISVLNMANLLFIIQLGQGDFAYDRARWAADYAMLLDAMANLHPGYYPHKLFLHVGRGHGFLDRLPQPVPQEVVVDYRGWRYDQELFPHAHVDTNAVRCLEKAVRNPVPEKVIWNLRNIAPSRIAHGKALEATFSQFYWLDLDGLSPEATDTPVIEASYDRKANAIILPKAPERLKILLNNKMLNLDNPITVKIGNDFAQEITVKPNAETIQATIESRGDPSFVFQTEIRIRRQNNTWSLETP